MVKHSRTAIKRNRKFCDSDPPGTRVTRAAPQGPGIIFGTKYISVWRLPARAKPPGDCVAHNCKAEEEAGVQAGEPRVPEKGTRSGARDELAMLDSKVEHCELNPHLFRVAFSGIERV